jgi:hypothetical protein
MFSVITNIYNKKTKIPILMDFFTAKRNRKKFIAAVKNIDAPMLTCVWQELEYHIEVCRVTLGAHIKHL